MPSGPAGVRSGATNASGNASMKRLRSASLADPGSQNAYMYWSPETVRRYESDILAGSKSKSVAVGPGV